MHCYKGADERVTFDTSGISLRVQYLNLNIWIDGFGFH